MLEYLRWQTFYFLRLFTTIILVFFFVWLVNAYSYNQTFCAVYCIKIILRFDLQLRVRSLVLHF